MPKYESGMKVMVRRCRYYGPSKQEESWDIGIILSGPHKGEVGSYAQSHATKGWQPSDYYIVHTATKLDGTLVTERIDEEGLRQPAATQLGAPQS